MMPRQMAPLPRTQVKIDSRGRITIPEYMREAAKIEADTWVNIWAEPSLEECRGILIFTEREVTP